MVCLGFALFTSLDSLLSVVSASAKLNLRSQRQAIRCSDCTYNLNTFANGTVVLDLAQGMYAILYFYPRVWNHICSALTTATASNSPSRPTAYTFLG